MGDPLRHHVAPLVLGLLLAGCGQASPSTSSSTSSSTAPSAPEAVDVATAAATGGRFSAAYAVAVEALPVADEVGAGYDRDLFDHWVDVDGNGCDARDEVLLAEALERPEVGPGCDVDDARWRSVYDGVVVTDPSDLDVDHVVALAEAWASGARGWGDARRERFANDLGDRRSLAAVTASSNRSKSDRDPAEWLPDRQVCRYAVHWTATKLRWRLAADGPERRALLGLAERCPERRVVVQHAWAS